MSEIETRHPDWKTRYEFAMGQLGIDPRASDPARKNPRIKLSPPDNILLVHLGSLIVRHPGAGRYVGPRDPERVSGSSATISQIRGIA